MIVNLDTSKRTLNFIRGADLPRVWGMERTFEGILIHHWGIDGQHIENVVHWFAGDPDNKGTSAHEVIGGNTAYLICDWGDVAWHAGSRINNARLIGLELRPEADDTTIATAAARIRAIRDKHGELPLIPHGDLKNTDCPGRYRALLSRLDAEATKLKEPAMPYAVSPFQGRFTQNHGTAGGYKGHRGIDIAPPSPGQTNMPVYAMFAGTVVRTANGVKPGSLYSTWAPGRTGNGILIRNPDGEAQGYNHVRPVVKAGDKVKAGQLIGYNDRSGNQTAPHLHFETWANWRNASSDYNPVLAFKRWGIKCGEAPELVSIEHTGNVSKPSTPSVSKPTGKAWPAGTLPANASKATVRAAWDKLMGDIGMTGGSTLRRQKWLKREGYYKGRLDNKLGAMTTKALQQLLTKRGFYNGLIDGKAGRMTEAAEIAFLNDQRKHYK